MRPALFLLPLPLLFACGDKEDSGPAPDDSEDSGPPTDSPVDQDQDGDGYGVSDGDCDDADPAVFPGRSEDCDGADNNCNGLTDEGLPDADSDGVADCMDTEECDGLDNDGDGVADEGEVDTDGDGLADCADAESCDGVDNDGDGQIDEGFDGDGDGYVPCGTVDVDCDDSDATVYPGGTEQPGTGADEDCDLLIDEGDWAVGDLVFTELMINPDVVTDPNGEWFEVYNASSRTVHLSGLRLVSEGEDEEHTVSGGAGLTLAPGQIAVFAANGYPDLNGGVDADYVFSDLSLSNEADRLTIYADTVALDSVVWDDGATMPDPVAASLSLDPDAWSASANDSPSAWCVADAPWGAGTELGSPGELNPQCL